MTIQSRNANHVRQHYIDALLDIENQNRWSSNNTFLKLIKYGFKIFSDVPGEEPITKYIQEAFPIFSWCTGGMAIATRIYHREYGEAVAEVATTILAATLPFGRFIAWPIVIDISMAHCDRQKIRDLQLLILNINPDTQDVTHTLVSERYKQLSKLVLADTSTQLKRGYTIQTLHKIQSAMQQLKERLDVQYKP